MLQSVAVVFCVAVMFAYEQCLLVLGHHPDVWYEAAQYLEQSSKLLAEKGVRDLKKQPFRLWIFCEIVLLSIFQLKTLSFFLISGYE